MKAAGYVRFGICEATFGVCSCEEIIHEAWDVWVWVCGFPCRYACKHAGRPGGGLWGGQNGKKMVSMRIFFEGLIGKIDGARHVTGSVSRIFGHPKLSFAVRLLPKASNLKAEPGVIEKSESARGEGKFCGAAMCRV